MLWLTKRLHVKIAGRGSFLVKVSRRSTKRRASKTNRKDVLPAEPQRNNNLEITETTVIGTNIDSYFKQ